MKRILLISCMLIALPGMLAKADAGDPRPVDMVYTQLDTYHSRWIYFSSACRPFGMVNLSPDTQPKGVWASGYIYDKPTVYGFSHIHAWQMSGISVLPVASPDGNFKALFADHASGYSHEQESAEVGYHSVMLDRYGIKAELTSTVRVGVHHYTFDGKAENGILFSLDGELGPCTNYDGEMSLEDEHTLTGSLVMGPTGRRAKAVKLYFRAETDVPVVSLEKDEASGVYLVRLPKGAQSAMMKVGISYVSKANAALNIATECPGWDFQAIVDDSKAEWNALLSRIEVEGGSYSDRCRFYTDLWHSLLGRRILNDVNGAYPDNTGKEFRAGQIPVDSQGTPLFNHFNSDSFWGAQWSLAPLWGLVYPEIEKDFVNSLMQYYKDGGMVPRGPSGGNYTYVMTGASATPFIVGAIQKGIVTDDLEFIYNAMKGDHEMGGMMDKGRYQHRGTGWGGLKYYIENGYVPYPIPDVKGHTDGAGLTMECAFQDFTLAQLALKLGHKDDYKHYMERSQNFRNIFDAESGWMRPKDIDGNWLTPFDPYVVSKGFVEASAVQSTWYVPQDMPGLAKLLGGKKAAAAKLNECFEQASELGFTSGDSHEVELKREYQRIPINYGNQPSTETAFVFHGFGRPDLSQYWSRQVIKKAFSDLTPNKGYNGDEDQGQMGAIGVLMKIGLFQLDAGTTAKSDYQIGSPIFDKVTIHLSPEFYSGKDFVIVTKNNSDENTCVAKAKLNGRRLRKSTLTHKKITRGGTLVLDMSGGPAPIAQ